MSLGEANLRYRSLSQGSLLPISWLSLLKHEEPYKGDVISEIFDEYAMRIEMPLFQEEKKLHTFSALGYSLMEGVLRDIFMKYTILKDGEKTKVAKGISRLLGYQKKLWEDIEEMFHESFDSNWKSSQLVHRFEYETKKESIAYETLADGFFPEVLTRSYELPLLRYRLVRQLNLEFAKQNYFTADKVLDSKCASYRKEVSMHALLHSHEPLTQVEENNPSLLETSDTPTNTPTGLRKRLTETVKYKTITAFQSLRGSPLLGREPEVNEKNLPVEMIKPLLKVLNRSNISIKLSPQNINSLFSYFHNYAISNIGIEKKEVFEFLSRLGQIVYKMTSTDDAFDDNMKKLAQCMRQIVIKQHGDKHIEQEKEVWNQLISMKLKEKDFSTLIKDLNMACVSIYRQIIPEKLNEKIPKFLTGCNQVEKVSATENGKINPLIDLFNQLSMRVIHSIVTANDSATATNVMQQWIKLAMEALRPPILNLHIAYAILSGVNNIAVDRLQVNQKLSKEYKEFLDTLTTIFAPDGNFKNYRKYVEQSLYPVIPFFGMISKDFLFATEVDSISAEQTVLIQKMINDFKKMITLLKTIVLVKQYKTDGVTNLIESVLVIDKPPRSSWKEGEWENFSEDDKLYYLSKHNWPTPRDKDERT
jgi:hypothetical protein